MKKIIIVLLVSKKYEKEPYKDDLLLQDELLMLGYVVDIVAWSSKSYDFSRATVCIVRSCWDFHNNQKEYFESLKQISCKSLLLNSFDLISSYLSKEYLLKLKELGVKIIPTVVISEKKQIIDAIDSLKSERIVIKPTVSASGDCTYRAKSTDISFIKSRAKEILQNCDVIIQAYIKGIESFGEISSVVIDGEITFSMLKKPKVGDFLVHEHHGGCYKAIEIDEKQRLFVEKIIDLFEEKPLYARVDYLFDAQGEPMLLELELNEPNIYLTRSSLTLSKLSQKIDNIAKIKIGK